MKKKLSLELIKKYEKHLIEEERSKATVSKYIRDIQAFYMFLADKAINKEAVISFKLSLENKYKTNSINSMIVAINGLLEYMGLSACRVKLNKVQKRLFYEEKQELTKSEYSRLVETAIAKNDEQLALLMQTICATGIRISELKYITVEALKNKTAIVRNKGKVREIIFPKRIRKALLNYCKEHHIKSGCVFVTKNGNPLDRSNIWAKMKKLCNEAGVDRDKVFPHNLRHLFAFTFYKLEKDLVRLADILGHSSIETTRIYTKTSIRKCQGIMEKMNLVVSDICPETA